MIEMQERKSFLKLSIKNETQAPVHVVASGSKYGREDKITDLCIAIIKEMAQEKGTDFGTLG